ncbi:hypothetical protein GBAR_LOCUS15268 [Geodia barretti]|uniref:Uncharacterized protein n=1 Tax=Geodia barretti TaxID=519541 RepID=A0AA35WRN5_GEOBA|nr:hypothetical protein GBAR_LOCUS15268 [Geodia barretti]
MMVQETTTVTAAAYANETDLSRRVADWEAKIKPILDNEANDGNVEISTEGLMDAVGLKLLSTRRRFENVANYRSSSH